MSETMDAYETCNRKDIKLKLLKYTSMVNNTSL